VTIIGNGRGATATASIRGGKVDSIIVTNAGTDYSFAVVSITGGEGSGAAGEVQLRNTIGDLRIFYYKDSGEKAIINENAGTIDYKTGEVILDSLKVFSVEENDYYDDNILSISVQADDETIRPLRNRIITIDENDARGIDIQMIAE
jgi:hypothetical protein